MKVKRKEQNYTMLWAISTSTAVSEELTRHLSRIERRVSTTCNLPAIQERMDIYISVAWQVYIMKQNVFQIPSKFLMRSLKTRRPVQMRNSKMHCTFTERRQALAQIAMLTPGRT